MRSQENAVLAVLRKNDEARKITVDKVVILIPIKRNLG
jgi:hypothetical protein